MTYHGEQISRTTNYQKTKEKYYSYIRTVRKHKIPFCSVPIRKALHCTQTLFPARMYEADDDEFSPFVQYSFFLRQKMFPSLHKERKSSTAKTNTTGCS